MTSAAIHLVLDIGKVSSSYTNVEAVPYPHTWCLLVGGSLRIGPGAPGIKWSRVGQMNEGTIFSLMDFLCIGDYSILIISVLSSTTRSESELSGSIQWVSSKVKQILLTERWTYEKDSRPASAGSVHWNLSEWSLRLWCEEKGPWLRATKGGLSDGCDMLPGPFLTFSGIGQVSLGWRIKKIGFDDVQSRTWAGVSITTVLK